jgi:pectin methylesterase-like acyl-CoA thioesterase
VQAALNSLSKTNTTPTQIRIAPGTYKEKLTARASQSKQLSEQEAANYTLTKIFGAWVPSFSK